MSDSDFMYMGKHITIHEDHPNAVVTVDGREFHCHHHHPEDGDGLDMWMCDEAYFSSPDLVGLAKHFADYGYMFDSPGRVVVNEAGEVVDHTMKRSSPGSPAPTKKDVKKSTSKKASGHQHGEGR
jgi:hypothetical protein